MKYTLPKGTSIDRKRVGETNVFRASWEKFVTTKEATYTDADLSTDLESGSWMYFMIPPETGYDLIQVYHKFLISVQE